MQERSIYQKYQERLINISGRNRSLVLNQIHQKRGFDLVELLEAQPEVYQVLIESFLKGDKQQMLLLPDPQTGAQQQRNKISQCFKSEKCAEVDQINLLWLALKASGVALDNLDGLVALEPAALRLYLDQQVTRSEERLKSHAHGLQTLYREVEAQKKENGLYNLRIATYFVEGRFNDETKCRAPLGLLSVMLIFRDGAWYLQKSDDMGIDINDVLLHAMAKCQPITPKVYDIEIPEAQYILNHLLNFYAQNNVVIAVDQNSVPDPDDLWEQDWFVPFIKRTAKDFEGISGGQLALRPFLVLGDFPKANAIYEDYQLLIDQELASQQISALFGSENKGYGGDWQDQSQGQIQEQNQQDIDSTATNQSETTIHYINELDYSQELALRSATSQDNLVIFGPPGTGKSQTITNIIADCLVKGQRVLMVSQKKAALNVIYNRLGNLQSKALLLHDANLEKQAFYLKNTASFEALEDTYGVEFHYKNRTDLVKPEGLPALEAKLLANAQAIDDQLRQLTALYEFLHQAGTNGYNGQTLLYQAMPKAKIDPKDPMLTQYRKLYQLPELKNLTSEAIKRVAAGPYAEQTANYQHIQALSYQHPILKSMDTCYSPYQVSEALAILDRVDHQLLYYTKVQDWQQWSRAGAAGEGNAYANANANANDRANANESARDEGLSEAVCGPLVKALQSGETPEAAGDTLQKQLQSTYKELLAPVATGAKRLIKLIFQHQALLQGEADNAKRFEGLAQAHRTWLAEATQSRSQLLSAIDDLQAIFQPAFLDGLKPQYLRQERPLTKEALDAASGALEAYREAIRRHQAIAQPDKALLEAVSQLNTTPQASELEAMYCTDQILQISQSDTFRQYYDQIAQHPNTLENIHQCISDKRMGTRERIMLLWDQRFIATAKRENYRELKRISALKRRVRTVREAFKLFPALLQDLYPVVLMGPETVSNVLPLTGGAFDVIIFDEASQMFVEDAIPALYRAKRAIVSGDDKQLSPNSAFKARVISDADELDSEQDVELDDPDDYNNQGASPTLSPDALKPMGPSSWEPRADDLMVQAALEEQSLLDLAKVTFRPTTLMFHYRSHFEELINFSNFAFYGGKLRTIPNLKPNYAEPPIRRIHVAGGLWENRANIREAAVVADLIENLLRTRTHNQTIGVITFNITQKDAIEDLLEARMLADPEFGKLLLQEQQREEHDEDVSLFVKNIENVQGDERDIIIFSTGYAPDKSGRLTSRFGSLSQDGGENRLNVAISRAKKQIYVVTSFEPEDLKVSNTKNRGPQLFKQYLQYAKHVSAGEVEAVAGILNGLVDGNPITVTTEDYFDSDFERGLCQSLRARGHHVKTQVGASGYKIDLVIYNPDSGQHLLGIECDGATYGSSKSAKENDIYRQQFLASRGWQIFRVWSLHWWRNAESVLEAIDLAVREQTGVLPGSKQGRNRFAP